jgi:hypothetical protein
MNQGLVVAVVTDFDGAPVCFNWEGRSYTVISRPVRWYSRKRWWQQAGGAPRGAGAELIEIEMWRLWAASDQGRVLFELSHQLPEDTWEISQIG